MYYSTKYRFSKSFVLTTTPLSWMINALYTVETREGRSYIAMKMHFFSSKGVIIFRGDD